MRNMKFGNEIRSPRETDQQNVFCLLEGRLVTASMTWTKLCRRTLVSAKYQVKKCDGCLLSIERLLIFITLFSTKLVGGSGKFA